MGKHVAGPAQEYVGTVEDRRDVAHLCGVEEMCVGTTYYRQCMRCGPPLDYQHNSDEDAYGTTVAVVECGSTASVLHIAFFDVVHHDEESSGATGALKAEVEQTMSPASIVKHWCYIGQFMGVWLHVVGSISAPPGNT